MHQTTARRRRAPALAAALLLATTAVGFLALQEALQQESRRGS
jgi:hypothetical protein